MCSISGFIGRPNSQIDIQRLHAAILAESSIRGDHATGFALRTPHGISASKLPISPDLFVEHDRFYHEIMESIEPNAPVSCISHTRFATQGDADENENNHPHYVKDELYLVHNGVLNAPDDDSKIWEVIETDCDSEYLLRAVQLYGYKKGIKKIIETGGTFAALFMDNEGNLILTRDDTNPMFAIDIRDILGVYVITSTEAIFAKAFKHAMGGELSKDDILKRQVIAPDYSVLKISLDTLEPKEIVRFTVTKKPATQRNWNDDDYLLKYFHEDDSDRYPYDASDSIGRAMVSKSKTSELHSNSISDEVDALI